MPLRSPGLLSAFASGTSLVVALGACGDGGQGGPGVATAGSGGSGNAGGGGNASASGSGNASGNANGNASGENVGGNAGGGGGGSAGQAGVVGTTGGGGGTGGGAPGERDYSSNRDLFFGASRCAAAGVAFCEDFESGTLAVDTWKTGGTAPMIDGVQAARGSKALHVSRTGNGNAQINTKKPFPAMNGRYWGRAFVYLNAMPHFSQEADSLGYSHWTIIAATGGVVAGEVRLGGQLQKRFQNPTALNYWGVGTDNRNQAEGSGDWTNADNDPAGAVQPVKEKEWSCVEWLGDYMTDETKFFLDGVEHPSLATTPTTKHGGNADKPFLLPEFSSIWFGWAEYQPTTQAFELWFDEIALDHERIGCVL